MNERERAIEARVNAATPGEWRIRPYHNQQTWVMICADIGGVNDIVIADVQDRTLYPDGANNAEFIAAAPADIRYLLARVRELEAALAKTDTVIEGVYQQSNQPRVIEMTRNYLNERGE